MNTFYIFLSLISIFIFLTVFLGFVWSFRTAYKIYHPKIINGGKNPSLFKMEYIDFNAKTKDGFNIKGWLAKPTNGNNKTIIICHNIGASKEKFLPYAKFLYETGYNIALFDFRSHGESDFDKGAFKQAIKSGFDIEAVISFLEDKINTKSIGVMGFSFGAIPAIYAVTKNNSVKAAIVDSGPPNTFDDTMSRLYGRITNAPRFLLERIFKATVNKMVGAKDHPKYILKGLENLSPKPIFFIHGEKDNIIPKESSEILFSKYAKEPKQLWIVPDSHHLTNFSLHKEEYIDKVTKYFSKYL